MKTKPSHTKEDHRRIAMKCREIKKLDEKVTEKELRWMLYQLGVVVYRQYFKKGIPCDVLHPGLNQPQKVWSSVFKRSVDERMIEQMEAQALKELAAV